MGRESARPTCRANASRSFYSMMPAGPELWGQARCSVLVLMLPKLSEFQNAFWSASKTWVPCFSPEISKTRCLPSGCSNSCSGGGYMPCLEHQVRGCPWHKRYREMDRRTQGRHEPQRPSYLGIVVYIHDVDWPVAVTHKKYSIFIRLKDIQ